MPQDEVDEIEVYGSEAQSGTQLATYSFEVSSGAEGSPTLASLPPDRCGARRCVTASSTSDPVPTLPWASLPSSLKRCLQGEQGGRGAAGGAPSSPPTPCSFRTVLSQTWRSSCALATGRMGRCRSCRCAGGGRGAPSVLQGGGGGAPAGAHTHLPFQKSIRPQVVTTFELPGCYDMWTVIAPVRKEQVGRPGWGDLVPSATRPGSAVRVAPWLGTLAGLWDSCAPSAFTGGGPQGGRRRAGAQRPRGR